MGQLVAGVDCSTQSTKVLVIDTATGGTVAEGRAEHDVATGDGRSETDPQVWWDALAAALKQTGRAGDVDAIAIGGQQHGLVLQDDQGRALRPAVLWNDTRSAEVVPELRAALGGEQVWAQRIGSVPVASFTVTSLAWLRRHEPDVVARAAAIRLPHDHLTERLTGRGVSDRGDASGTGWWSPVTGDDLDEVLELPSVGVDRSLLPEVLGPGEVAGHVTAEAAAALGLREGIAVGAGTGDNMAAALGLGVAPGVPVVSLGTSGTAYTVSRVPTADPSGVVAGFAAADGGYLPLVCTLNCTLAVDRFAQWLGLDRDDVAERSGCVVLPYLDGERTPDLPLATGTVVGLQHATSPGAILLAAYEGAVAALLTGLSTIADCGGALDDDAPVVLLGGGAKGATWRSVIGRLSGRPLLIPEAEELVALGGAVQAASVLSGQPARDITQAWGTSAGQVIDAVEPDHATRERIARVQEAVEPALLERV
jgi:xylulokinase